MTAQDVHNRHQQDRDSPRHRIDHREIAAGVSTRQAQVVDGEEGACEAWSMASSPDGVVVVTGVFRDPIDFDPGRGVDRHTPTHDYEPEAFVFRLTMR